MGPLVLPNEHEPGSNTILIGIVNLLRLLPKSLPSLTRRKEEIHPADVLHEGPGYTKKFRSRRGIAFSPIASPSGPLLFPAATLLVLVEPPALLTVTEPDNVADGVDGADV